MFVHSNLIQSILIGKINTYFLCINCFKKTNISLHTTLTSTNEVSISISKLRMLLERSVMSQEISIFEKSIIKGSKHEN